MKNYLLLFFLCLLSASVYSAETSSATPVVKEGLSSIRVKVGVPLPSDISSDTQAKALSREAAVALAQRYLLDYVLQKKTRSGKLVSEAESTSPELHKDIRGTISHAEVLETEWEGGECFVTVAINKKNLKAILKKN